MNRCRPLILTLVALALPAMSARAQPTTAPTAAPTSAQLPALVAALASRDPLARSGAREQLMLLSRDELPALREAARQRLPLAPTQRALLREVVLHVYLASKHNFAGVGRGYVGIGDLVHNGQPPIVRSRVPGYDSFRVLDDGDVIVAIGVGATPEASLTFISSFNELQIALAETHPGDQIALRVLRGGRAVQTRVRLGPPPTQDPAGAVVIDRPEAELYWTRTFLPELKPRPATPPATTPPATTRAATTRAAGER